MFFIQINGEQIYINDPSLRHKENISIFTDLPNRTILNMYSSENELHML